MSTPDGMGTLTCRHPDCTLPEGGRCARAGEFADPLTQCPELERTRPAGTPAPSLPTGRGAEAGAQPDAPAPWQGRLLDPAEADALLRRAHAVVISVIGPHDAGKTCLLTAFFLQLAQGQRGSLPYRFASSRSLYGFYDLALRAGRWDGALGTDIVGHTARDESAEGGRFLHLGLRPINPKDDRHVDVLLSDVPGEWVTDWGTRDDDSSDRRLGFLGRSDAVLLVADAAAFLSPQGRQMDHTIAKLMRRATDLVGCSPRRPTLALVFSKFDLVLDRVTPPSSERAGDRSAWGELGEHAARTWAAVRRAQEAGQTVALHATSAFPGPLREGQPVGVVEPFAGLMRRADARVRWRPGPEPIAESASSFEALRRRGSP